jgi:hypothetical protein
MSQSPPLHPPASAPARSDRARLDGWLAALADRHLADLRLPEVTRALRALSAAYVERRHGIDRGVPLQGTGKRAAFALFYGPLHFMTLQRIAAAMPALTGPFTQILDLGCGTGATGAALALAAAGRVPVLGLDRHPWAVREARWTYHHFGLIGHARESTLARLPPVRRGTLLVAGWLLNELPAAARQRLDTQVPAWRDRGATLLVVEPIARRVTPWWDDTAGRAIAAGGRADEWRFPVDLPEPLRLLDRAAGLRHDTLTARTILVGP